MSSCWWWCKCFNAKRNLLQFFFLLTILSFSGSQGGGTYGRRQHPPLDELTVHQRVLPLLKSTLAVLWRCSGSIGMWCTGALTKKPIISVKLLYLCGEHKWSFVLFKNGFICATKAYIIISFTERHQNKLEH